MHFTLQELWKQMQDMSLTEIAGAITALASVALVVRNSIWTWPWGIVSSILYTIVFYKTASYANAGLQIFCFVPLSVYAWWFWLRGGPKHQDDLPITALSPQAKIGWLSATIGLSVMIVWAMIRGVPALHLPPDQYPYADGITTAISIIAQYLQARKWIENWLLWIAADLIYVFYLFPVQKLYPTTLLYVVILVLAIMGWIEWRKILVRQEAEPLVATPENTVLGA